MRQSRKNRRISPPGSSNSTRDRCCFVEAYQLAARAYVAAGDLTSGLDWAKRAIRLMPENPFLLVMMADTAAKQGDLDLAVASARDALRYLEHALAPSPISTEQWPSLRARMRATALFVLGRVAAARAQLPGSGTVARGVLDAESR